MAENHASLSTDEELVTEQRTSFFATNCKGCWLIRCDVGQVISIDILPDEVILGIFYSYLLGYRSIDKRQNAWHPLVHVCRRWRAIVFGSPHHLDLQLICTARTHARKMPDAWPALPIYILCIDPAENVDNIIAVLERTDRVYAISMNIRSSDWEILLAAMQQPFPELRSLGLYHDETALVVPDSIVGGFAPRLLSFYLYSIQFLGLPKLLLSATHLVTFPFGRFLIPAIFHPTRWSLRVLPSPR